MIAFLRSMLRCPGEAKPSTNVMTTVYTIGHSNHASDGFLSLLRQHGIELLVDVRSSPYSRYVPQANREPLARALASAGMAYLWFGDRLGGKPEGAIADYDQLRAGPAFQQTIADLLNLAAERRTAIMCSEGDHRQCHRHKLITPALLDRDVHVLHIQPDGDIVDENSEPRQLALF
jgi:uncharacterized protein (DUF488 family)